LGKEAHRAALHPAGNPRKIEKDMASKKYSLKIW
jgi:hypothetical protein